MFEYNGFRTFQGTKIFIVWYINVNHLLSPTEKAVAPHSSLLAWKIQWTEEPGRLQSDTTERLHFHFSLSRIGEGNGNPLQCACLENPRDGGAWWAAVYGVAQSQTQLARLSSSSFLQAFVQTIVENTLSCPMKSPFHLPTFTERHKNREIKKSTRFIYTVEEMRKYVVYLMLCLVKYKLINHFSPVSLSLL